MVFAVADGVAKTINFCYGTQLPCPHVQNLTRKTESSLAIIYFGKEVISFEQPNFD